MILTKIVATLGPASCDQPTLLRLLDAGVDICRLNFSHGTLENHAATLANIRAAAEQHGHPVAVLGDLCGPKIRLGTVKDTGGTGGMPIEVGDDLVIQREPIEGENGRVSSTFPPLIDDVKSGDRVLIEDGLLRFVTTETARDEIRLRCTAGGVLKTAKGINLPDTSVSTEAITDKDWQCVDWAMQHKLDFLALSFVRRAEDVQRLRDHLRHNRSDIEIIPKIEKPEAIAQIDSIIEAADGLMVARGDLGVEMDLAEVPLIQKDLILRCQRAAKPVIVATQMLQSMIESSSPTRAEVSDVANAIFDGTDAVMLSGETSVGRFPVPAVHTMSHIAQTTEEFLVRTPETTPQVHPQTMQLSAGVARGVRQMVDELNLKLIIIYSQTGSTARIFSKFRFPVPIIALSSDQGILRKMNLHFGVQPMLMPMQGDISSLVGDAEKIVLTKKLAREADRVAIVAGSSLGAPGTLNGVVIHTLGRMSIP